MADASIYIPLPPQSHTIRLLDLQPGEWNVEIEVELRETPIAKARNRYTSISYTWGNANATKQLFVTCNGRRVLISENLYTILRRLRRPDFAILVWADALCINQDDPSERTHQVGLMGEIYRNSKETVIWLGEQTDNDDVGERFLSRCITKKDRETVRWGGPPRLAWENSSNDEKLMARYLGEDKNPRHITRRTPIVSTPLEETLRKQDIFGAFCLIYSLAKGVSSLDIPFLGSKDDYRVFWQTNVRQARVWAGLERLMSRAWWTRIWVIQETVLSRKATVQFGMLSAPWSMFAGAAANYEQERHNLCLDLSGSLHGDGLLSRFSHSVLRIDNTRQHYQAALGDATLLSLLWKFRPLEASDKRDKVFALLGLTSNWQGAMSMVPDYQIDARSTFLETAVNTIQRSQSLSVLAGDLDPGLGRKRLKGIASWVMDWALPCLQLEIERVDSLNLYDASGGRSGTIRLHQQRSVLEVEGVYAGEVIAIGEISRHTQINDTMAVIRNWNFLAQEVSTRHAAYPNGDSYQEAFWRTLLGDIVHVGHTADKRRTSDGRPYQRAKSSDYEAYEAWRMWSRCISRDTLGRGAIFTQRDLDEGISSINYALKTATASRRFFITRNGYMGIGPSSTRPGDRIYALKDCRVPFLVRPDSLSPCGGMGCLTLVSPEGQRGSINACDEVHSCHRLVGDCFAYGLMDGEAFEQPSSSVRKLFLA
ncbi:heterokaryon incompatibility protein-domain-containing protein [Lophiotrema nucula]|uniref:Heterokaryon incompatibility protein-domain-containing protein n=1 Tax=Lophiotrema nucula TaxID=690887 RepID=A0A6A5YNB2_9PLEO|nr:heterokaryon incompatibility protein-domain-containing protein [Lophiotrema nucula]